MDNAAIILVAADGSNGDMVSYRALATMLTEGKVRQPLSGGSGVRSDLRP